MLDVAELDVALLDVAELDVAELDVAVGDVAVRDVARLGVAALAVALPPPPAGRSETQPLEQYSTYCTLILIVIGLPLRSRPTETSLAVFRRV